ncbi:MAG: TonB-dependent receptor [Gammaproteobacteria bacterium]
MIQKPFVPRAALALAGLLSCPGLAVALDGEAPAELDDVLITAALEPLSVRDVASSVTVITREQIEQRQVKFLADLLRDVPGFNVSQSGGPGAQTQVRVRGAEANQLLVLIDGVRANDPASSDEFQYAYALTADIERIEIVRGPQSAVWGSDAIGGVINIIRRSDARRSWLAGHAEGGSFDTVDLSVSGGWSGSPDLQLRGAVAHSDTDGINMSRGGGERDGSTNTTADVGLDWNLGDAWRLSLSGQHVTAENDYDGTDFIVTGLPADSDFRTEVERNYLRGEARWEGADSDWSGSASVNWSDSDNRNFADGAFDSSTAVEVLDLRLRGSYLLAGAAGREHRFTAGLDRIDTDFAQRGTATDFGDPNQDQSYDQTGYALEYVGRLAGGLTWNLSGRYDEFSDFDSIATGRIGASQPLGEDWRLRASWGTGFKTPTFTERYGFFPDQFVGNPDLKPEESRGWEVGVERFWADGAVRLDLAWFDQTLQDEIDGFVFDPETFLFTARNRDTDSRRKGLELVFDASPRNDLTLGASYTYTDATESRSGGVDFREVRRPRHMASFNADWRFAADRGGLNLNVNYTGEQDDLFFDPATFVQEVVRLDAYTVADLAASWKLTDALELVARVTNLTDADYEEVLGYARPGRAYYGGLRGRFDF